VLLLAPVLWYVKRRERALLAKGRRWNDSVAEMKMMIFGMVGMVLVFTCGVATLLFFSWKPATLLLYLVIVIRSYESGVSDARSAYTHYKLLTLPASRMEVLVMARKAAMEALVPGIELLDPTVKEEISLSAYEAAPTRGKLEAYLPWLLYRLAIIVLRRTKKDWNEVLRLQDYATMDYIPDAIEDGNLLRVWAEYWAGCAPASALRPFRRPSQER